MAGPARTGRAGSAGSTASGYRAESRNVWLGGSKQERVGRCGDRMEWSLGWTSMLYAYKIKSDGWGIAILWLRFKYIDVIIYNKHIVILDHIYKYNYNYNYIYIYIYIYIYQSWDSVLFWYLRYRYSVLENGSFGFGISVLSVFRSFGIGISVFRYRYLKKTYIYIYKFKNTFNAFNIFFSPYKTYSKPLNIFQSPSSIILVFLSLWQPAGKTSAVKHCSTM